MRAVITLICARSFFSAAPSCFAANVCPTLVDSTPALCLEYLQGERARLSPACVRYAVAQYLIGKPAVPQLVETIADAT